MLSSRSRAVLLGTALPVTLLVGAPVATAATSATGTDQPAAAPAPAPAPAPVSAKLTLGTEGTSHGQALKGDRWRALVVLDKPVAGARVTVTFTAKGGGKRAHRSTRTVALRPSKKGNRGVARVTFRSRKAARVVVRAEIPAGGPVAPTAAHTRIVRQATPSVHAGERGFAVRRLQTMLGRKGYVVGRRGVFDARTRRAVLAFRKLTRMARTTRADSSVFGRLRAGRGAFRVRYPKHGRHIEASLSRQVIALIGSHGKVESIYPNSSGKPSTPTIRGSFRVYRKDAGTNSEGMVDSSYFIRGYAIHGYHDVPVYAASHGCLRIAIADAPTVFHWIHMGTPVDVY